LGAHSDLIERDRHPPRRLAIVCSQLSLGFRFNTRVQSANDHSVHPHWLQVLFVGRRPKATLVRIAVLIVACFITFKFILLPIRIEGISMLPTYRNHQFNCINRLAYLRHEPQRGDIVSVRLAGISVMFMKRIIGLPGETVCVPQGPRLHQRPAARRALPQIFLRLGKAPGCLRPEPVLRCGRQSLHAL
jgi:hypothetical protein